VSAHCAHRTQWAGLVWSGLVCIRYGVDLYLCAHQHNYERTFDVVNGTTERRTVNMRATTHILSGAGEWRLTEQMCVGVFERLQQSAAGAGRM
jgi:hypothetical protein